MKPINYGRQEITQEDIKTVVKTLKSDFLTQGPQVKRFEEAFAKVVGSNHAVACSNGTAALHLCAMALKVNEASHFITTPITFVASANAILYCGGKISFCDIDPTTGLMDLDKLQIMITNKPKGHYTGIIAVHLAGYPIDMEKLKNICDQHSLKIIEDACHAPGGYFTDSKNKKQLCGNGKFSDAAIFSFHPVKHIATGEGGMVTTNSKTIDESLRLLRTHGITRDMARLSKIEGPWYYEMQELGYNYRMPDILCALGVSQLKRLNKSLKRRHEIAKTYDKAFEGHPHIQLMTPSGTSALAKQGIFHAHHLYVIKTDQRNELYTHLASKKIHCQVHYIPVYRHPFYETKGYASQDFPQSEKYYQKALSLPMYSSLTKKEQNYVIQNVLNFF